MTSASRHAAACLMLRAACLVLRAACLVRGRPGDIDIFVGSADSSKRSRAAFIALVAHAKHACREMHRHYSLTYSHFVGLPHGLQSTFPLPVRPLVKYCRRYNHLGDLPSSVDSAMGATDGHSYTRSTLVNVFADQWPHGLRAAMEQLPPTLGIQRPYRVEHVAEIHPFGDLLLGHASCRFGTLWPMPPKINIVQYARLGTEPGAPLPPLELVSGFDVLPAMVVMQVDRSLRPTFLASEATTECVRQRTLRLSKYAFGPAASTRPSDIEDAALKQIDRIRKYERRYGFALPTSAAA